MKKLVIVLMVSGLLLGGCATLKQAQDAACDNGPLIKARIRAFLQIAQVGYPKVAQLAGQTSNPDVQYKIALIDASLDLLGQLAYDLFCPGVKELNQADAALDQAQKAKSELGIE